MSKLVPKIRFKEFNEDWEQCNYGDICKIVTKQTGFDYTATIKESLVMVETNDTLPYLQTKNFSGINVDYNTDYFIPKKIAADFPKINLDEKCVLFSIVGASVGNIGYFPGIRHCFLSGAICVSKLKNEDDSEYAYHFMTSENGQNQIRNCTKGGAQATVTIEDIRNFKIILPTSNERTKVASFLSSIDNLITLHQCKFDNLIKMKKTLLKKMIPFNKENSPNIRFKGFSEKWIQSKFGTFGSVAMNKRIFKYQTSEQGDIPFYKIGTFGGSPDSYISEKLYEEYKSKYPYPNAGDILVSASGSIGKTVEFNGEKAYFQDSNIVWLNHNGNFDNKFLKQLYSIVEWNGLEGSTIKRLYNSNFLDTDICVPSINEQKEIGKLFDKIDKLINLYGNKIEIFKKIKSTFLNKMFV